MKTNFKKIIVIGAGISGQAAAKLAKQKGFEVILLDQFSNEKLLKAKEDLEKLSINVVLNISSDLAEEVCAAADLIVISPGIPPSGFFKECLNCGTKVESELEFAYRFCQVPLLAVTGTNGKTTTVELAQHLLLSAGKNSVAAGNIGFPFSEAVLSENLDCILLEISSFQLENIDKIKFFASVITNITSDHIDRYRDFSHYAETKLKIIENTIDKNNCLAHNSLKNLVKESINFYSARSEKRLNFENLSIRGEHNLENAIAASFLVEKIGVSFEKMLQGLKSFKLSHYRMEEIFNDGNISVINDSKSTNSDSLIKALEQSQHGKNIILIAGGKDKQMDFSLTKNYVKKYVKFAILIGESRYTLRELWENVVDLEVFDNFEFAVEKAISIAEKFDTILLSPGFASIDMFVDYKDRGDKFNKIIIRRLKNEK